MAESKKLAEIYVDITSRMDKLEADLKRAKGKVRSDSKQMSKGFSSSWLSGIAAVTAALYSMRKVFNWLKGTVTLWREQASAMMAVKQAVQQTGQAAGWTADELYKVASQLQRITGIGDETILRGVTAQLLTFTNIADDAFQRAQKAVLDINAVVNQGNISGLTSQAIQLGKALNDPVANLGALSRSGIQFSAVQKDQIKLLAKTNRLAEAQAIMLSEIEKQYGGQAKALADANEGLMQANALWGDFQEQIGKKVMPHVVALIGGLADLAKYLKLIDDTKVSITTKDVIADLKTAGAPKEDIKRAQKIYMDELKMEILARSKIYGYFSKMEDAQREIAKVQEYMEDSIKKELWLKQQVIEHYGETRKYIEGQLSEQEKLSEKYRKEIQDLTQIVDLFKEGKRIKGEIAGIKMGPPTPDVPLYGKQRQKIEFSPISTADLGKIDKLETTKLVEKPKSVKDFSKMAEREAAAAKAGAQELSDFTNMRDGLVNAFTSAFDVIGAELGQLYKNADNVFKRIANSFASAITSALMRLAAEKLLVQIGLAAAGAPPIPAQFGGTFAGGKKIAGFAQGGAMKIPPYHPNDSFLGAFSTNEIVKVTPANKAGAELEALKNVGKELAIIKSNLILGQRFELDAELKSRVEGSDIYLANDGEEKIRGVFR